MIGRVTSRPHAVTGLSVGASFKWRANPSFTGTVQVIYPLGNKDPSMQVVNIKWDGAIPGGFPASGMADIHASDLIFPTPAPAPVPPVVTPPTGTDSASTPVVSAPPSKPGFEIKPVSLLIGAAAGATVVYLMTRK